MVIEIGVAPALPAEFIIFDVVQKMGDHEARRRERRTERGGSHGRQPGKRREAFGAYYFAVEIERREASRTLPFRSCSGLKSESEVVGARRGRLQHHHAQADRAHQVPQHRAQAGLLRARRRAVEAAAALHERLDQAPARSADHALQRHDHAEGPERRRGEVAVHGRLDLQVGRPGLRRDARTRSRSRAIEIAHEGLMMLAGEEAK